MINEERARNLQNIYLLSRDGKILALLQQEIESICKPVLFANIKRNGSYIKGYKLDEIAYESSTRFIEMYLKNPNWYCINFAKRIDLEAKYFLYNYKQIRKDSETELLDTYEYKNTYNKEDTNTVIQDIMCDTIYWRNILLNCYKSKQYKKFILSIEPIVGRRWIYDHAVRLRKLYKFTRR